MRVAGVEREGKNVGRCGAVFREEERETQESRGRREGRAGKVKVSK